MNMEDDSQHFALMDGHGLDLISPIDEIEGTLERRPSKRKVSVNISEYEVNQYSVVIKYELLRTGEFSSVLYI